MDNKSAKILVVYHKPYTLIKNENFICVHAGRDVYNKSSKDGKLNKKQNKWLMQNLVGDNSGDNISAKNREYCELTAIYWAWKNYDKIGNPDFAGLMHYRRHFLFNGNAKEYLECFFNNEYKYSNIINELISRYDVIMPKRFEIVHKTYKYTPYTWYKMDRTFHHIEDYDKILDIVRRKYPDYDKAIEKYNNQNYGYFCNMFLMKKSLFFEYCSWLFDILEAAEEELEISKYKNAQEKRVLARLSEWLTGIFYIKLLENSDIKSIEIPVIEVPEQKIDSILKLKNLWHKLKPIYF